MIQWLQKLKQKVIINDMLRRIETIYHLPGFWLITLILQGSLVLRTGTVSLAGVLLSGYVYFLAMPACGYFIYKLVPFHWNFFFSAWLIQTTAILYINCQTMSQSYHVIAGLLIIQMIGLILVGTCHKIVMLIEIRGQNNK